MVARWFTDADAALLRGVLAGSQIDTQLTLYRLNEGSGVFEALPVQGVKRRYSNNQPNALGNQGIVATQSGVTFYREPPFDVRVGDSFALDGHGGGVIARVTTDINLNVIVADARLDVGSPS